MSDKSKSIELDKEEDIDKEEEYNIIPDIEEKEEVKQTIKHKHGKEQNVLLTEVQYASLKDDLGDELLNKCIEELSLQKAMKGYKYKRDDLAIRKWVVEAVKNKGYNRSKPSESCRAKTMGDGEDIASYMRMG